jgi:hypothetical protein
MSIATGIGFQMGAMMTNKQPVCRYCPDKVVMIRIGDDLYECPECCYEENLQSIRPPASDLAKKLIGAGVYDAEPISETPRTDAMVKDSVDGYSFGYAWASVLERELNQAIKERDKARECLREAIAYRDRTMSGYDLQEWLEALGEGKQ